MPDFEDDFDDPVVRTIDVFANPHFSEHLALFQYPLRPAWRPYETIDAADEFKIRPESLQVSLSLPIPHGDVQPDSVFHVARNELRGERLPMRSSICAGLLTAGGTELHITPVRDSYSLTPTLARVDTPHTQQVVGADGQIILTEAETGVAGSAATTAPPTSAARAAADRWAAVREAQTVKEEWVDLKWAGEGSSRSLMSISQLRAPAEGAAEAAPVVAPTRGPGTRALTAGELVARIAPERPAARLPHTTAPGPASEALAADPEGRQRLLSTRALAPKSVDVIVETALRVLQQITYARAVALATRCRRLNLQMRRQPMPAAGAAAREFTDNIRTETLSALVQHGVLIQGVWCARSELVARQDLVPFRNYLLLLLHRGGGAVDRRFFADTTGLPPHTVRELLGQLTGPSKSGLWRLRSPADRAFAAEHADVAEQQAEQWARNAPRIQQELDAARDERTEQAVAQNLVGGHYVGSRILSEAGTTACPSGTMTPVLRAPPSEAGGPAPSLLAVAARRVIEERARAAERRHSEHSGSFLTVGDLPAAAATPGFVQAMTQSAEGVVGAELSRAAAEAAARLVEERMMPRGELRRAVQQTCPELSNEEVDAALHAGACEVRGAFVPISLPDAGDDAAVAVLADIFKSQPAVSEREAVNAIASRVGGTAARRQGQTLAGKWLSYFADRGVGDLWVFKSTDAAEE